MKVKAIKIAIPTITGLLAVGGIVQIESLLHRYFVEIDPNSDTPTPLDFTFYLFLFLPAIFWACVFQLLVLLPIWTKYKSVNKLSGFKIWHVVGILSLLIGVVFGLLFWSEQLGVRDLIESSLIGTSICVIYWAANLLTLSFIDKKIYNT